MLYSTSSHFFLVFCSAWVLVEIKVATRIDVLSDGLSSSFVESTEPFLKHEEGNSVVPERPTIQQLETQATGIDAEHLLSLPYSSASILVNLWQSSVATKNYETLDPEPPRYVV